MHSGKGETRGSCRLVRKARVEKNLVGGGGAGSTRGRGAVAGGEGDGGSGGGGGGGDARGKRTAKVMGQLGLRHH